MVKCPSSLESTLPGHNLVHTQFPDNYNNCNGLYWSVVLPTYISMHMHTIFLIYVQLYISLQISATFPMELFVLHKLTYKIATLGREVSETLPATHYLCSSGKVWHKQNQICNGMRYIEKKGLITLYPPPPPQITMNFRPILLLSARSQLHK